MFSIRSVEQQYSNYHFSGFQFDILLAFLPAKSANTTVFRMRILLAFLGCLDWLTIRELIDFATSKMVFKSQNALAPDYLRNIFQKVSEATNRQLRNSKTDFRLPLLRTSTGQKSFAYRGAKVWSDLDGVVKASSSFCSFRRNYKAKL